MKENPVSFIETVEGKPRRVIYIGFSVMVALLAATVLISGLKSISVKASTIKVGMIFSTASYDDHSFSWQTYQGLVLAESQLGVDGTVYTSTDQTQIEPQVQHCAQDGNDLCIGVGFPLIEPISNTAGAYPDTKFAVIDGAFENNLPNVRGIQFASEQVGYLAGTLAGLMSHSDIIGGLGGYEIPPVTAFTHAYRNGAQCANPSVTTIISYTNDFSNPGLGEQYARGMISRGADVIFSAAGATGNGAIITATRLGVWAIGVDTDQYYSVFMSGTITGSTYLLTSAMKRTDNAVFLSISDVVSGLFTPGTITYTLEVGGVELAPFHQAEEAIHSDVRLMLDWVKMAIIDGRIDPLDPEGPCLLQYKLYMPFTKR